MIHEHFPVSVNFLRDLIGADLWNPPELDLCLLEHRGVGFCFNEFGDRLQGQNKTERQKVYLHDTHSRPGITRNQISNFSKKS